MHILLKPWFAMVVAAAAVVVCLFTLGLRDQTQTVRLDVHGDPAARQSATSPAFSFGGGPATLTISATPAPAAAGGGSLIASVDWALLPQTAGVSVTRGSEGLMTPDLSADPLTLTDDAGKALDGGYRLRLAAAADAPATIAGSVVQRGTYWHGFPVFWLAVFAAAAYVILAGALALRGRPRARALPRGRHELE
jgi:hypothetical protein